MRTNYAFSNLLGTVYKQGNVCFTPDGTHLLSPVGNKLSAFDLKSNRSFTFPFETAANIRHVLVSPNGMLVLVIDENGRGLLAHFYKKFVFHRVSFKSAVTAAEFSPCGRIIALALEHKNLIQLWKTPFYGLSKEMLAQSMENEDDDVLREFSPLVLLKAFTGHHDEVTSISWSSCGRFILTSSKDMTAKIFTRDSVDGYKPLTLAAHRDSVVGAWFIKTSEENVGIESIVTVTHDGACFIWTPVNEEDNEANVPFSKYKLHERHFFGIKGEHGTAKVKSASFHYNSRLLCAGFSNGVFGLYELPNFTNVHQLSVSQKKLESVAFAPSGEWIALASAQLGQLLVWEWQSETYIMKQQGHYYDMNTLAYSSEGRYLVTGGDDGKVKIWDTSTGFCFVTFNEHMSSVTAAQFAGKHGGKKSVVFTASLDGTVRAFDLLRFRNFRTFTSPEPVQFSCLAVDPSGEIICAGSLDSFEIYVWSVQTGNLLDILAGHEGPIVSLAFAPDGVSNAEGSNLLISGSWDKTVRVWDLFSRGTASKCKEILKHKSEVLSVAYKPDGKEICASTLDGLIQFWDPISGESSSRLVEIDGRKDIAGGRLSTDRRTAKNTSNDKHFNTICYSPDGNCLIGGGNSKWICLYDLQSGVLLKKFRLSHNMTLDGQQEKLNTRKMTEAGPVEEIDDEEFSDIDDRVESFGALPGAKKGNLTSRKVKPAIRCKQIQFAGSGREWAVASTEGLVIYSLDESIIFDPFDLDVEIKPEVVLELLKPDPLKAFIVALRLNEPGILQLAYENIPFQNIDFIVNSLPVIYVERILKLLAIILDRSLGVFDASKKENYQGEKSTSFRYSPHIEFHLVFLQALFKKHGKFIREHKSNSMRVLFRALKKNLTELRDDLNYVCDSNKYAIRYLRLNEKAEPPLATTSEESKTKSLESLLEDFDMI
jgi:periodic tryptophan protein 2